MTSLWPFGSANQWSVQYHASGPAKTCLTRIGIRIGSRESERLCMGREFLSIYQLFIVTWKFLALTSEKRFLNPRRRSNLQPSVDRSSEWRTFIDVRRSFYVVMSISSGVVRHFKMGDTPLVRKKLGEGTKIRMRLTKHRNHSGSYLQYKVRLFIYAIKARLPLGFCAYRPTAWRMC